jgi:hypothetical protein
MALALYRWGVSAPIFQPDSEKGLGQNHSVDDEMGVGGLGTLSQALRDHHDSRRVTNPSSMRPLE